MPIDLYKSLVYEICVKLGIWRQILIFNKVGLLNIVHIDYLSWSNNFVVTPMIFLFFFEKKRWTKRAPAFH